MIKRNALICGSTQGIGLASAQALAKSGYSCILLARNEASLKSVVATLDVSEGQEHQYLVADFSNPSELKTIINNFIAQGHIIHVLINNTGGPKGGPIIDAAIEEFTDPTTTGTILLFQPEEYKTLISGKERDP